MRGLRNILTGIGGAFFTGRWTDSLKYPKHFKPSLTVSLAKQGTRKSRDSAVLWQKYCQTWTKGATFSFFVKHNKHIPVLFMRFHLEFAMKLKGMRTYESNHNCCSQTFWNTCSLCLVGVWRVHFHIMCRSPHLFCFTKTLLLLQWRLQYRLEEAGSRSSL